MSDRNHTQKIILIKRKTRLEELVVRHHTISQAQFYIERLGADFSDYLIEDEIYRKAIAEVSNDLSAFGRLQLIEREHIQQYIFGKQDIVVVVGQDGLVANTLKYLQEQPLIGVNSDPVRFDGHLLPFTTKDIRVIVPDVLKNRRQVKEVTLAQAQLNDGQVLYGVNDLFVGRRTHMSARYHLTINQLSEQQSSSGIIISTGLGATGWFRSVLAGAAGIVRGEMNQSAHSSVSEWNVEVNDFTWQSPYLYFTVREPFPSQTTATKLVFGQIHDSKPLRITSQMPEDGVIFSDGVESDYLAFNSGVEATIGIANRKGQLIV
ncbi:NAD(+)/NADH kinase [Paenibacillus sinopodophylli]|uniref:NAD(+)/NADH kinase n=1 Tax=Paenibacillus sinopodophylli TaxID=1837342 RepID=UPI00110D013B|nr:NAD(+)/NADH kinase [Paenibacillus sinopodophylli]